MMAKDRSVNPAQAQRKLEKQKAVKKGKAEALARRNEKLARRNPERIQRQINDLKEIEESGQPLRPREKQILEELQRDLRAVQKARDALGGKAPQFGSQSRGDNQGGGVLGKRRREGHHQWKDGDGSDTDESVRNIPMPRDTPPPIPRQYRERWRDGSGGEGDRQPHPLPQKPETAPKPKTVYESAPVIRDLRREAVSKFVPATVRRKQEAIKGQGNLVEPEEMDRLEKAGYLAGAGGAAAGPSNLGPDNPDKDAEDAEDLLRRIEAESRTQPSHTVGIEEVPDQDL